MQEFIIDFTDQINAGQNACPECGELPCVCGSRSLSKNKGGYPGESVERRKDGVPKKKMKKRACKPGEHRGKDGNLKKTKKKSKAYYSELWKKVNEKIIEDEAEHDKKENPFKKKGDDKKKGGDKKKGKNPFKKKGENPFKKKGDDEEQK